MLSLHQNREPWEMLAVVIAQALATPAAGDIGEDPDVLLIFTQLLEHVPRVTITPQLVRVATGKMRGASRIAELYAQIFAQLCSEKFERVLTQALAGRIVVRPL